MPARASTRGSSRPRKVRSRSSTRSRCRNTTPICRRRSSGRPWHHTASRCPNSTRRPRCICRRTSGCAIACRCRSARSFGFRSAFRQAGSRCTDQCRRRPCRCSRRRCRSPSHHCRRSRPRPMCRSHPMCLPRPRRSLLDCLLRRARFRRLHQCPPARQLRQLRVERRRRDLHRTRRQVPFQRGFRRRYPKWHCRRPARKPLTKRGGDGDERGEARCVSCAA